MKIIIVTLAALALIGGGCSSDVSDPSVFEELPIVEQEDVFDHVEGVAEDIEDVLDVVTPKILPGEGDTSKDNTDESSADAIAPGKASTLETDDGSGIQSSKVIEGLLDDPEEPVEDVDEVLVEPVAVAPVVKSFSMTAKQWEFVPATITVNKGDTVKLTIESVDVDHGFNLFAFGVNENLKPGQSVTVEFVADKVGTHSFTCNVFCGHGHSAMSGTLVVNEG